MKKPMTLDGVREAFQSSNEMVWVLDDADRIVYANPAKQRHFEWMGSLDDGLTFVEVLAETLLREIGDTERLGMDPYRAAVMSNWWRRTFSEDTFYRHHANGDVWQVRQWRMKNGYYAQARRRLNQSEIDRYIAQGVIDLAIPSFRDFMGVVSSDSGDEFSYLSSLVVDILQVPTALIDRSGRIIHGSKTFFDALDDAQSLSFESGKLMPNEEGAAAKYSAMIRAAFRPDTRYPGGIMLLPKLRDSDPQFLRLDRVGTIQGRGGQWPAIVLVTLSSDRSQALESLRQLSYHPQRPMRLLTDIGVDEAWKNGPSEQAQKHVIRYSLMAKALEWITAPIVVLNSNMEAKWSNRSARTLFRRSARWTIKSNALKPKAKKYAGVWKDIQSLSPGTLVQVQLPAQSKGEDTWCVLRSPTGFTHLGDSDVLVLVGPAPTVSEPKLHHELQSVLGIGEAEGPAANVLKSLSRQAVPWPNRAYLDLQDDADGHASLRRIIEELKSVA